MLGTCEGFGRILEVGLVGTGLPPARKLITDSLYATVLHQDRVGVVSVGALEGVRQKDWDRRGRWR